MYIESTWEDLDFDDAYDSKDTLFSNKYWTPELFVENSIGILQEKIEYKVIMNEENKLSHL